MKIFCIGRNYSEHAKELQNAIPDAPVVFMKPPTAVLKGNDFYLPPFSDDIHYECELVFRICKNGKHIDKAYALKYMDAVTVGIDFTARDLQSKQKQKGLPWEIAKAFDHSAVVGTFTPIPADITNIRFRMDKNGETVQNGFSGDMLFSVSELIAYISTFFTLQQGDLLFTGTPEGVGKVSIGDRLEGFLEGEKRFSVDVK
ncbi:MAG: fumarylacetoacetate hydrolase family protein [Chitinophagales bacterium]